MTQSIQSDEIQEIIKKEKRDQAADLDDKNNKLMMKNKFVHTSDESSGHQSSVFDQVNSPKIAEDLI